MLEILGLIEIQLGVGLDHGVAGAEDSGQHGLQRIVQALLVGRRFLLVHRPRRHIAGVEPRRIEDVTVLVDDGYLVGRETFDAGGNEMDDRLHLLGPQARPWRQGDEDRRAGLVGSGVEQALLRDDHVDLGRLDAAYGLDGLFELIGDGLLVLDLLLELRRRNPGRVEEAVALVTRGGQAGGSHVEALLVDVALGDHDLFAVFGQLVRDLVASPASGLWRAASVELRLENSGT